MEVLAWVLVLVAASFLAVVTNFPHLREWEGVSLPGVAACLLAASAGAFALALIHS